VSSPYITGSVVESPVGLILAESRGQSNAMTANFFSEVAHHPTSLWVSIATSSYTHELVGQSGRFSLVVLHPQQKGIAQLCGSVSGRDCDKCARLAVYRSSDGFLFLRDALASIACRVRSAHPLGDHTLFVADILHGQIETRRGGLRHLVTSDMSV
jgi:flavin reductase (DIM6/NTAB) family NADH-FMN oxidoreductase RutF